MSHYFTFVELCSESTFFFWLEDINKLINASKIPFKGAGKKSYNFGYCSLSRKALNVPAEDFEGIVSINPELQM